jgi:NAD(P)-dependent dehydrogenase (short-subunit alcohol dehydrogenase family)
MKDLFSIKDKVVIITGGGGTGMANHISNEMAKQMSYVYSIDVRFPNPVPIGLEKNLFQIKCDITDYHKFQNAVDKIFIKYEKIDVLINGAGITTPAVDGNFYPLDIWNKTVDVNLTAAFTCSQSVIKHMIKKRAGSIINFTSINAEMAFPNNPAYVASKGGLKMLSKALAKDWGKYGIRVNSIGPGYMKTEMTKKSYSDPKRRQARTKRTLLGRWGEKDDIVGPCIFLASDASRYVTGQDIYVDGGWLANGLSE